MHDAFLRLRLKRLRTYRAVALHRNTLILASYVTLPMLSYGKTKIVQKARLKSIGFFGNFNLYILRNNTDARVTLFHI